MWEIDGIIIKEKQLSVIWQWLGIVSAVRWGVIYRDPDYSFVDWLKRHELTHQAQQLKQSKYIIIGYPIFCIKYAWQWLKLLFTKGKRPYEDNPFEKEADALQFTYQGWLTVTKDSWKNYKI